MIRARRERVPTHTGHRQRLPGDHRTVVCGGGLAGVAAATILAERGSRVTVIEREAELGGRVSAWSDQLASGTSFEMERGFHAFFRQYYNLRALLRRVDPNLGDLVPLDDYPILGPDGASESFTGLPHTPPLNVIALTHRTPHLGLRDLLKVNARAAMAMLGYDGEDTYARFDHLSAKDYLDSLRFPPKARSMLFNVFAHSFFNPEEDMSAAELLMMFHFYFMGNPEGLVFDVLRRPFRTAVWRPFQRYLEGRGAQIRASESVYQVRKSGRGWMVETSSGCHIADDVVLALNVPALQAVVEASPELAADIEWRRQVDSLQLTHPFAVWRGWLDTPARPDRSPFAGTTGVGILDNISLYERFEDESQEWAKSHRGSVVELHAYALPLDYDERQVRDQLLGGLRQLYPELASARVLEERFLVRRDCPAFPPGSHRLRPTVASPHPGVALAGDFVRLPMPSALMERAATSGMLAANHLLARYSAVAETVYSVPRRGLFARPGVMRRAS